MKTLSGLTIGLKMKKFTHGVIWYDSEIQGSQSDEIH
jgi:hypothetical protein